MAYNSRRGGGMGQFGGGMRGGMRNQYPAKQFVPQLANPIPAISHQPQMVPAPQQLVQQQSKAVAAPLKSILKKDEPMQQSVVMQTQPIEQANSDTSEKDKSLKPWKFNKGKISKKEQRGRRNQRFRKILQPKNALMVLNELVGSQKAIINEKPMATCNNEDNFSASISLEGEEFVGYGKNKAAAKSMAAELALKSFILKKLRNSKELAITKEDSDSDIIMTTDNQIQPSDDENVSWMHIASFAIHKLFVSWDSEGILTEQLLDAKPNGAIRTPSKNPAKELPTAAQVMNPVMLLNQMRPDTRYEDVTKDGNPPHTVFTTRCVTDGDVFTGKGPNKKLARKNAAYAACSKLFNISYPKEEYDPDMKI